jgi:hypothetical protein
MRKSARASGMKWKVAPTRAKVFSKVDRPVSDSAEVVLNIQLTHMYYDAI